MERNELKRHSTRNVILRIDYIPLTDEIVDSIKTLLATKLINEESGFSKFNEAYINNIDIKINDINDPNIQDSNNFLNIENNSTRTKSFEYYKEIDGNIYLKLLFNKYFMALEIIQDIKYCKFEEYQKKFLQALNTLISNVKQNLIITRYGFRKLNDFFVKENSEISNYVTMDFFKSNCDALINKTTETLISEKRYSFNFDEYNVNLFTHVSKGNLKDDIVKRIAFDIDLYSNSPEYLRKMFDSKEANNKMLETDEYIFKIFSNLLNPKFLEFFKSDEEDYEDLILGVLNNE